MGDIFSGVKIQRNIFILADKGFFFINLLVVYDYSLNKGLLQKTEDVF